MKTKIIQSLPPLPARRTLAWICAFLAIAAVTLYAADCAVCVQEDDAYLAISTECSSEDDPDGTVCRGGCHQTVYTHRELCVTPVVGQVTTRCEPNGTQEVQYYLLFWPCTPREFPGSNCEGCDVYAEPYSQSGPYPETMNKCKEVEGCGGA